MTEQRYPRRIVVNAVALAAGGATPAEAVEWATQEHAIEPKCGRAWLSYGEPDPGMTCSLAAGHGGMHEAWAETGEGVRWPLPGYGLTPGDWQAIDSIIDEAAATRHGPRHTYTQREAVAILLLDRSERGIVDAAGFARIEAYMFGHLGAAERARLARIAHEIVRG